MASPTPAETGTASAGPDGKGAEAKGSGGSGRFDGIGLVAEPVFLMARAASLGSADANRALAGLGLKVRGYSALAVVCSGRKPTQRELSEFLVMLPSRVVAILDELERRGLVQRTADPRDRRSNVIVPTEAGLELYARAKEAVDAATEESLGDLTPKERQELARLLTKAAF
ncbi:MarR family winged helix-turn-helix transcriptional regulator [Sinomonas sp. R1AF57]|uniref:MarR family winged helix-turn-helix transcriptional regulator n=1 Tax=Sinomonas sp. R1AF57 TaxID=2020377 RepID=UPI000B5EB395|nr:MarR family winged helix-turn-helix transcriptional regulator [Sinomonas sp. R1AF57]ASN53643.1 MarR family transcriptional regulator [Sinomonas sp. R1AF57]